MKMDEKEKASERKQERKDSIKLRLLISILSFLIVSITEVYVIINAPSDVQTILLATIMLLIAAYFVVDSAMMLGEQRTERLAEQYEEICDAQKAAYAVVNTSFEEMGEILSFIERILKISTDEIINAQKGTSKVIINRNKENAEAILQSYVKLSEKMEEIQEVQTEKLSVLDILSEKMVADVHKQMEWNMQQLAIQMKDMELHLNQSIMQNSKVVVSQAVPISMPENMNIKSTANAKNTETFQAMDFVGDVRESNVIMEKEDTHYVNCESVEEKNKVEPTNTVEVMNDIPEVENFEDEVVFADIEADTKETDITEIKEVFADVEVDTEETDITEMAEPVEEEIEVAPEFCLEEPMLEISEHEPMPELVVEEPPIDESIPEDITMTEILLESIPEEPKAEEVKPPMPDLSNPNKIMTPDEIAALIANTESIPEEPKVEEVKPPMPDLSDPNKVMTPDEIAALIANL